MMFINNAERLKRKADRAKQKAELEKKALMHKLQTFFSKDQSVTVEVEHSRLAPMSEREYFWEKDGTFVLPALSVVEASKKIAKFINFYEKKLKCPEVSHICAIESENNINNIVLKNDAKRQLSPPGGITSSSGKKIDTSKIEPLYIPAGNKRIKELDKMARSYGKALTKHWECQKSLGDISKPMPIKNDGR